ncbi:hypothetical protein FO519_008198 [Halicephalobus sp. NKZ332]|nr:hypothetical protein FO519_008198 [Halicephalobus sp. NKZ332]
MATVVEPLNFQKIKDENFLEEKLCGKSFTAGWLLESLRTNDEEFKRLHGNRKVKNIEAVDISGGKGFISIVMRCTVHFENPKDEEDIYTTVVKVPGTESIDEVINKVEAKFDLEDKFIDNLVKFHKFECDFYMKLAPKLEIPIPKVHKTMPWIYQKADGCLHMEDLTTKGKSLTFFETMTIPQIRAVVRHLAHMHKQFLTMDESEWRGSFLENQKAFTEGNDQFVNFFEPFLKMTKGNRDQMAELIDKYTKMGLNSEFISYVNCQAYKDLELQPILVHGDLWGGNTMWKLNDHGDITNEVAAFIDWQICHEGSPMSDVARIMTLCCDGSVRREAELFIFDYYHDLLTKDLAKVGKKNPYTVDGLRKAYNICFFGQCLQLLVMPVFLEGALQKSPELEFVNNAKLDKGVLRAIHAWEDMDRKLQGEYKYLFEKYDDDGNFTNEITAFVDWQACHEGSPMDDFARVITVCVDGNIRREFESFFPQFYIDTLTSELSSEGFEVPYTVEKIQEAYDYMFMAGAIQPLFMTVFLERTLEKEPHLEMINKAKIDKAILRAIHALEDVDRLLSGKYKHIFEKYGK